MKRAQIEELGRQARLGQRLATDPIVKSLFDLLHKQTVELRKGTCGLGLETAMIQTARALLRT